MEDEIETSVDGDSGSESSGAVDVSEEVSALRDLRARKEPSAESAREGEDEEPVESTTEEEAEDDPEASDDGEEEAEDEDEAEDTPEKKPGRWAKLKERARAAEEQIAQTQVKVAKATSLVESYYQDNVRLEQEIEDARFDFEELQAHAQSLEAKMRAAGWTPDPNEMRARDLAKENAKLKRLQERGASASTLQSQAQHEARVEQEATRLATSIREMAKTHGLQPKALGEAWVALSRTGKSLEDVAKIMRIESPKNQARKRQIDTNNSAPRRIASRGTQARVTFHDEVDENVAALNALRKRTG